MPPRKPSQSAAPQFAADTRVCIIVGQEEMLRRQHFESLCDVLKKAHGETRVISFDGATATLADVFDEIRTFSMMSEYKIVVVDECADFVKTHREPLERYADNPVDHATLVLRSSKWNAGNLDKKVAKVGCIVKCEAPKDRQSIKPWIMQRVADVHNVQIDGAAVELLVDRLGTDLMRIDNELGKLAALSGTSGRITRKMVEDIVGAGSQEAAWMIQEAALLAISRPGSTRQVMEKLHELVELARQPEQVVIYFIADLMRKLHAACQMRDAGASNKEIFSELRIFWNQQQAFAMAIRNMSTDRAFELLDAALTADKRSKSGLGDAMLNLETFCAALRP